MMDASTLPTLLGPPHLKFRPTDAIGRTPNDYVFNITSTVVVEM